jgi:hypothetical protein
MKKFLIFLAVAFPVVLASPAFWTLVKMEWSVERVGYGHEGGVTQWAMLGPKAPWPNWAPVPEGAKLTVQSSFEAAPGYDASGYGEIGGDGAPRLFAERYEEKLRADGWTVRVGRFDATYPEIPPRPLHWCFVHGRRGNQVVLMSVDIDEPKTAGRLHWADGKMDFPIGAKSQPCWTA